MTVLKRVFDIVASVAGLVICFPILVLVAILVKLSSRGPVFFCQERVGRRFQSFWIYKFRSMALDAPQRGAQITAGDDPRITPIGKILRMTKVDELPQLLNVLKGDMSIVGPRPEVPTYVARFRSDYEEILQVRPGITDLASIKYRDEAAILGRAQDPEREYLERILPEKIRLSKQYARRSSLRLDLIVILQTLWALAVDRKPQKENR